MTFRAARIGNTVRCLAFPVNFIRIRFSFHEYVLFVFPVAAGALVSLTLAVLPGVPIAGRAGLIGGMNSLLGVLAGFYIAALAAVATFTSPSIDGQFLGERPVLKHEIAGTSDDLTLNRRQYLSMMFGFLSLSSLLLYVVGVLFSTVPNTAFRDFIEWSPLSFHIARFLLCLCYFSALALIMTTTMLGLYFLSFAIHKPIPELHAPSPDSTMGAPEPAPDRGWNHGANLH